MSHHPLLRSYALFAVLTLLPAIAATAATPPAADALTENSASAWSGSADSATVTLSNDTLHQVGAYALRFDTTGCYDTKLWSPVAKTGAWNLATAGSGGVAFWVYPVNTNGGAFQSFEVRLCTSDTSYYRYVDSGGGAVLNAHLNEWQYCTVPWGGNGTWTRTVVGSPSWSNVNFIEIHADTWGCNFTLYFDGLTFGVPMSPPPGQTAIAGNANMTVRWQTWPDPGAMFQSYKVYRSTTPFTSTVGLTARTTITNINTLNFTDSATNGTSYYYAVTVRMTNGSETTTVTPVGPRKPRSETDLQVLAISRTPRYPRYAPNWTQYTVTEPSGFGPYVFTAATSLGQGQTGGTQRWPAVGNTVTYTATIRNRGTTTWNKKINTTWRWDGGSVATGSPTVNLAAGTTQTFTYTRAWDGNQHSVQFSFTGSGDARSTNNSVTVYTLGAPFLTYVDRSAIEDFRDRTSPSWPLRATDDLVDWLQRHAVEMNAMFADAGSTKRVFYDVLSVLDDYAADPATPDRIYFGIFPFRYYYATVGDPRAPGYYHADVDIDYGLLHEMGHQLGLIDLYRLNMETSQNQVNGLGYSAVECLMNGCSDFFSSHSAGAMSHWQTVVHGYYGQYLYCLPQFVRMRFLDINGQALSGATVTLYQKCERPGVGEVVSTQVKATGTTDASGYWTLPNVAVDPNMVPPAYNGDTLHDNPFGYVSPVGTNGVFLFKVERDGFVDYAWLDITDVNTAWFAGQTATATFDRQVAIGGAVQYHPPTDLAELNAANWTYWVQSGTGSIASDTSFKHTGSGSGAIKFITDGGFDNYVRYPVGLLAQWNLSTATELRFWAYAVNTNNPQFQNNSPWIRLGNFQDGYFEYTPGSDVLNNALNTWTYYVVPLAGGGGWTRTTNGTPALGNINYFELHADTWGAGFTLWLDGVNFYPQP
jgi:hypothetical protein